jgi:hypothetical protein
MPQPVHHEASSSRTCCCEPVQAPAAPVGGSLSGAADAARSRERADAGAAGTRGGTARESRNYGTILSKAGEVWSGSGASVRSAPVMR